MQGLIFSSGTIFPTSSFRNRLLCRTAKEVGEISCSHVIESKQASVIILQTVASAKADFRFSNRDNFLALFEQIGHHIICVCQSVPVEGGIVVFVPSYQVLGMLESSWSTMFANLDCIRLLFESVGEGQRVFEVYKDALKNSECKVILVAVMGGSLSEGVNFSNELARLLILIGMPFPKSDGCDDQVEV